MRKIEEQSRYQGVIKDDFGRTRKRVLPSQLLGAPERAGAGWGRPLLLLLAGACSLALLGYSVYFDRQRRNAPDFQRKLRQKRRKEREKAKAHDVELCEMKNIGRVREFFLQEVQLGEHWLSRGEHKKSVEHLTNAISVCAQPHQLLQILHNTLPPQVFEMLMQRVPYEKQQLQAVLNEHDCVEDETE
ncbi:TOMM20-like protein 1 [Gopherus flavomarginatus]|uniref:TOMM20-like protein 1 n=1 Tax=Gopherus flavomarginatus TaxID=286002 RepID=UPI0021CC11A6|nr:TOMM20-like protein 1 [Gopherus flavomarginatus]